MNVQFLPVDAGNRALALSLAILPEQAGTVETVAQCLGEAAKLALWRPILLMAEGEAVGFAMYGFFPNEGAAGRLWLDRFFIDGRFQGRGLARAILPRLLAALREESGRGEVYLSVYEDNAPAIALYQSLGFAYNGELDENGELVMVQSPPSGISSEKR